MKLKLFSSLALLCSLSAGSMASTHVSVGLHIGLPPPVIVREPPPPRISEAIVVAPAPGYVWVAGHYSWTGKQWVWVSGAWMMPPQPGAVWVEGRWD